MQRVIDTLLELKRRFSTAYSIANTEENPTDVATQGSIYKNVQSDQNKSASEGTQNSSIYKSASPNTTQSIYKSANKPEPSVYRTPSQGLGFFFSSSYASSATYSTFTIYCCRQQMNHKTWLLRWKRSSIRSIGLLWMHL